MTSNSYDADVVTYFENRARITRADGTVHDLGVIDAHYKSTVKQLWWTTLGRRMAERRIRRANAWAFAHRSED